LHDVSLRRVINATGVVLHTNLGRAPLPELEPLGGYSNLEYDLVTGRRGKRDVHIQSLIEKLLGNPGVAVNNNAAAVYLVLNELAVGREVIVSRGELIEIGEGFRIPDIMARSGAILREIGTTNKTNLRDYRQAINENTALIMSVHRSNFRISGFTAKPSLGELAELGRERGIPVYEDLGSGCIADLSPYGVREPRPADSLRSGVNLVSFSGDKLLGGPQAGIIAGTRELVARVRKNPMFRALRLDKLIYQALASVLRDLLFQRYERIPALRMIMQSPDEIGERARKLCAGLDDSRIRVRQGESLIGGGSTPAQALPTQVIEIADGAPLAAKLRVLSPPVIARVENENLILDLRTVFPGEEGALTDALRSVMA
jgi:L-seryl-tRNA(Ser) seleniumtransferase